MLCCDSRYRGVPFFWTQQYGKSLRSAGYASKFDFEIIQGNLDGDTPAFTVYYMQKQVGFLYGYCSVRGVCRYAVVVLL